MVVAALAIVACGGGDSPSDADDAAAATVPATTPPTAPAAEDTPVPTQTPVPTPTQTPEPTATPKPTATPEPAATRTPVEFELPELEVLLGHEDDGLRGARGVNYTDWLPSSKGADLKPAQLDLWVPSDEGDWPIVVIMPGSDSQHTRYWPLADSLAEEGYLVVVFHYVTQNTQTPYQVPRSVEEATCAVRFARKVAKEFGSEDSRVVFVGHSFGGYIGAIISNTADDWTGSCLVDDESGLPDHFIGVAGFYSINVGRAITASVFQIDGAKYVVSFMGGTKDEVPDNYFAMDPINHIGRNEDLTITLISGKTDETRGEVSARIFAEELAEAGVTVEPIITDNGHLDVVGPKTEGGQAIVERVLELAPPG